MYNMNNIFNQLPLITSQACSTNYMLTSSLSSDNAINPRFISNMSIKNLLEQPFLHLL